MQQLLKVYPNSIVTEYNVTIDVFDDGDITVCFDLNDLLSSYAWDKSHVDLTDKLTQAIELIDINFDPETRIIKILKLFEKKFNKMHGFSNVFTADLTILDQFKDYRKDDDEFWNIMKSKYNVNVDRKLKIVTYGYQFYPVLDKFVLPDFDQIQVNYDVRVLRTNKNKQGLDFKALCKLRGTNLKVQQEIRETDMFETVLQDIIQEIEKENLIYIAICCNRGHHRSVACAEMLKYLYVNCQINHLTLEM